MAGSRAYPPYYIDNLPGILDIGRGSPTWGVFYEHIQFPARYKNAFSFAIIVGKAKALTTIAPAGRLVAFHLQRSGSRWKAEMETLVRPKPGAKDAAGRSIPFALVDVDVAPDGSLYVTEHNQGIWRIIYDPKKTNSFVPHLVKPKSISALDELLDLPHPASEWSRLESERLLAKMGRDARDQIVAFARIPNSPLTVVWPRFVCWRRISRDLISTKTFARDRKPEIRAQAAWLAGLRGGDDLEILRKLIKDRDPFVRRRALEAFTRHASMSLAARNRKRARR